MTAAALIGSLKKPAVDEVATQHPGDGVVDGVAMDEHHGPWLAQGFVEGASTLGRSESISNS